MNDLEGVAMEFVRSIADLGVADLRARYQFGRRVHRLREGAGVGVRDHRPVETLSALLEMDPSALRRQARVAATIPPEEFEELLGIRLARGMPLTWSHIEMLASVSDPERRHVIAHEMAGTDLSVRGLARKVRGREGDAEGSEPPAAFVPQAATAE